MTLATHTMVLSGLLFAVGEAVPVTDETGLVRYAVTQGGLLAVVLVLLYFQRQNEKDRASRAQDRIDTLVGIVEKSSDAHVANAVAIQRLATAVENFERK